jgi:lipopolysaccharide export LptBFGC system permease protein LptF
MDHEPAPQRVPFPGTREKGITGSPKSSEDIFKEKIDLVRANTKDLFDTAVSKLRRVAINNNESNYFIQEYIKYRSSRDEAESNHQQFSGIVYDEYEAIDDLRTARIAEIKKYPELLLDNSEVPSFLIEGIVVQVVDEALTQNQRQA